MTDTIDITSTMGLPTIVPDGIGIPAGGGVATFTVSVLGIPLAVPASDFTVTIDWGDGTTSPGVVTAAADTRGLFNITTPTGHTYDEGTFTTNVTITENGASPGEFGPPEIIQVRDSDSFTAQPAELFIDPKTAQATVTAIFTDMGNPNNVASDFAAFINWGDGTTSTGIVTENNGFYEVTGPKHTYAAAGQFTVTVTLAEDGGTSSGTAEAMFTVSPLLAITGTVASQQPSAPFINPFAKAAINDFANQTETVTITGSTTMPNGHGGPPLSALLSDPNSATDGGHFTKAGAYVFTGSQTAVNTDLQALQVQPFGHSINLQVSVTDTAGHTVTDNTTSILGISDVHHPV